jgi:hypothetical protein
LIGWSTATSGNNYGVQGLASGSGGTGLLGQAPNVGVQGTALNSSGVAGVFNNAGGGKILSGQNNGTEQFSVDGSGNITTSGSINSALTVQYVTDPCSGATSANLIGGFLAYNGVRGGVTGATIGGGGGVGFTSQGNLVTDDFGTVGCGESNTAGNNSGTTCDAVFATVAGDLAIPPAVRIRPWPEERAITPLALLRPYPQDSAIPPAETSALQEAKMQLLLTTDPFFGALTIALLAEAREQTPSRLPSMDRFCSTTGPTVRAATFLLAEEAGIALV